MHISWGLLYFTPCCKGGVANSIVHPLAPQHVSAIVFIYIRIWLFIVPVNVGNSFSRKCPHPLTFCVFEHSNPGKSCHCVICVKYKRWEPPSEIDLMLTHSGQDKMAAIFRRHFHMMTSSNGNIFRVTGHLCGEFTGPRWIPRTKASDAELWCFFHLRLNKRLSKQSQGWWFETQSHPLWRQCNDMQCDQNLCISKTKTLIGICYQRSNWQ